MSDAMKCIEIRTSTKRNCSEISQLSAGLVPDSDHIHLSKRTKLNSNISIDDLPDTTLAEILCRLPCKFVFQCKLVSKRWCTLISDPSFTGQFLCLQRERKTPTSRTLLTRKANEFLITKPTKAGEQSHNVTLSNPLIPLFKEIIACCSLEEEPDVVATCDDLVLCQHQEEHDYYICNPYTSQWFALPTPRADKFEKVGFLCDFDSGVYRCKVVGIPEETNREDFFRLKVEIFSSKTGEWKESIVSFTQEIDADLINGIGYAYNGMLYWGTAYNFSIGFDPFMINSTSEEADTIDHYKGQILEFIKDETSNDEASCKNIDCVGVYGGRLRFIGKVDSVSYTLPVWELQEEQDMRAVDRSGKMFLKCKRYSVGREMYSSANRRYMRKYHIWRVFDPNDEDILYVRPKCGFAYKFNIRTREWSRLPDNRRWNLRGFLLFPLILQPWWPTPVPS